MDVDISVSQFFSPGLLSAYSESKCLKSLDQATTEPNCSNINCQPTCSASDPYGPCWVECNQWNSNSRKFIDTLSDAKNSYMNGTLCKCNFHSNAPPCGYSGDGCHREADIGGIFVLLLMMIVIIVAIYAMINRVIQSTISRWPCFPKRVDYKVPDIEVDNDVQSYLDRFETNKKAGGGLLNIHQSNHRASLFSMKGRTGPQLRKHFTRLVIYKGI